MLHDRNVTNKINGIHRGALTIANKEHVSTFEKLLELDNSVTVHQRNLQLLMVEIYKTKYNLNPSFMKQIFEKKEMPYNLIFSDKQKLPKVKITFSGSCMTDECNEAEQLWLTNVTKPSKQGVSSCLELKLTMS